MYNLNIARAIKTMSVNEIRNFIFENDFKLIGFSKENSYYSRKGLKRKDLLLFANKFIEKIPDPLITKEQEQPFLRKKNKNPLKQSEIITYKPKTFRNPNIVDIKSVITEHPKTSHKLSKTIGKREKLGSDSSVYNDT